MGQAFRKLFDAFFGNKEMRVRPLLSSLLLISLLGEWIGRQTLRMNQSTYRSAPPFIYY